MSKIVVQNTEILVVKVNDEDYICLTDMMKAKAGKIAVSVKDLALWYPMR